MHRYRERDKDLVRKAKKAALKKYGRLACEACGFDFKAAYGPRGDGLIDAHHTKPLHTVTADHRTNVDDLALLCANCHRIVHATREWLTVQEVRELMHTET
ncbi:HNH endonuclease [compost metagenome]